MLSRSIRQLGGLMIAWTASAAEPTFEFSRLDLTDGRTLRNVVIKTYDAKTDKVLLIADGKATSIPRALIPPPFSDQLKQARASGEFVSTTTRPAPAQAPATVSPPIASAPRTGTPGANGQPAPRIEMPRSPAPTAPRATNANARQQSPNRAAAESTGINLEAHRRIATERAMRYYRHEFRVGSDSALMMGVEIDLSLPKVVPGWEGRCRAEGKAYLEIYDSRGRSTQRRTSTFEVITERKVNDDEIVIVDFTPKT